jgi:hypothetical protein
MDLSFLNEFLNNDMVNLLFIVFAGLYQCVFLPKLPQQMVDIADNMFFKILILTLVAFMANKNLRISLLIAVVLLLTINMANTNSVEKFMN